MLFLGDRLKKSLSEIGQMEMEELRLWAAWHEAFEPDYKEDWRFAMLAATNANCHLAKGRFTPEDFIPRLKKEALSDEAEMERQLAAWCRGSGGKVVN